MRERHIKTDFAMTPWELSADGMWKSTGTAPRGRLEVNIGLENGDVGVYGDVQLNASDLGCFLAVSARLGTLSLGLGLGSDWDRLADPDLGRRLRADVFSKPPPGGSPGTVTEDRGETLAFGCVSLWGLAADAGISPNDTRAIRDSLAHLAGSRILRREKDPDGNDTVTDTALLSFELDASGGKATILLGPLLTEAVFHGRNSENGRCWNGQYVRTDMHLARALRGDVARLLHFWLSGHVHEGAQLGNNGVFLKTLGPHIWGPEDWSAFGAKERWKKQLLLKTALERIGEAKGTEGTAGWSVKPLADIGREPEAAKAERSAETGDESKPGQIAGGRLRYRIVRLVRASLRLVSPPGKRPGGPGKRRYKVFRKAN